MKYFLSVSLQTEAGFADLFGQVRPNSHYMVEKRAGTSGLKASCAVL